MRRIVLDTNCLLMLLPSRSIYHSVWKGFLDGTIEFCVSTEIPFPYVPLMTLSEFTQDFNASHNS